MGSWKFDGSPGVAGGVLMGCSMLGPPKDPNLNLCSSSEKLVGVWFSPRFSPFGDKGETAQFSEDRLGALVPWRVCRSAALLRSRLKGDLGTRLAFCILPDKPRPADVMRRMGVGASGRRETSMQVLGP